MTTIPTHDEALAVVREGLARHLDVGVDLVPPTARVYELPGIDSMKLLLALMEIEKHYGVTVHESATVLHRTIDELAGVLRDTIEEQRA